MQGNFKGSTLIAVSPPKETRNELCFFGFNLLSEIDIMGKFFGSKVFVFISTFLTLAIGGVAGWLLGYQPTVSGSVSGWSSSFGGTTSGKTTTQYRFQIKTACGYWLLALLITLVILFLCIIIRKLYNNHKVNAANEK